MFRITRLLICPLLLLGLLACQAAKKPGQGLIVVSIHPYELLVRQLVGDSLEVKTLIPAKASPHTWSPQPSDLKALQEADLAISNGLGLEANLQQAFAEKGDRHIEIARLIRHPDDDDPASDPEDQAEQADTEHHQHSMNPHLWLSPPRLIQITLLLVDELQTRFPDLAETIGRNGAQVIRELIAQNDLILKERSTFGQPAVITYHDSFHYFLRDYDILHLGSVQSSPGREPTPKELSELGRLIRAHDLKAIYVEPQMDRRSAQVLAKEFRLKVIELDPLGYTFKPRTIMDVIQANWERMKQGW